MPGAPFPPTEYETRWEVLQRRMRSAGLDALLLTEMADFEYVTGYQTRVSWSSYTRLLAVLVPASAPPVLLMPDFLAAEAARVSGIRVRSYERIDTPPLAELSALITDLVGVTGRLGLELAGETRLGMTVDVVRRLGAANP